MKQVGAMSRSMILAATQKDGSVRCMLCGETVAKGNRWHEQEPEMFAHMRDVHDVVLMERNDEKGQDPGTGVWLNRWTGPRRKIADEGRNIEQRMKPAMRPRLRELLRSLRAK
jgi:hypothetical protein